MNDQDAGKGCSSSANGIIGFQDIYHLSSMQEIHSQNSCSLSIKYPIQIEIRVI
jgi:hypothetical protein